MNPKEITIRIKDEDKVYKQKFLVYEEIKITREDQTLTRIVDEATANFKGTPEEVVVKLSYIW